MYEVYSMHESVTLPFLCVKAGCIFSKSCWGEMVASISLHRAAQIKTEG
jgi:hypothetical protein